MSATGAIISGIAGLTAAGVNAAASAGATRQARKENYHYNELSAQNADQRTRALYSDLYSPGAQLQQLKDAGLSPSLMYQDGAGVSGQAGAQGAGTAGPVQNPFYLDPLTMAQTANLMADARLKNTEADKNEGLNATGIANIKVMLSQAGLNEAAKNLKEAETYMQNLQNLKFEDTYNAQVETIVSNAEEAAWNAKKAYFETENAELNLQFNKDTYDSKTAELLNKANEAFWRAQVEERKVELTEEQTNNLRQLTQKMGIEILQDWAKIQLEKENINNQKWFWQSSIHQRMREIENEGNKIYFDATNKHHAEENLHQEKTRELDWQGYKAILQAIGFYCGLEARSK